MKVRPNRRFKQVNPATVLLVKQFIMGFLLFCVVGLILTGIWYGTRLETFTISAINVSGGKTISAEIVHSKINDKLSGTYLGIVPKRFSFTYPKEDILESLYELERLKNVQVEMVSNQTMQVTFDEYFPDALWCDKSEKGPCLFLDENGYAFGTAPKLSGHRLLRYYALDTDLKRGVSPFETTDYTSTRDFIKLLSDSDWYVSEVEIDSARDVFYTLADGGEVKATLADEPLQTFKYLKTLLDSDEFKHLAPGNFQYIDLRFGTKVFVNEEPISEPKVVENEQATSTDMVEDIDVASSTSQQ
ncbi:MAG: hypothetical protein R3B53_02575 [Candidatus Paceibacterota bacterium]